MKVYSVEHTEYLKKKKVEKKLIIFFQILIFIVFLGGWEILVHMNLINSFLFSSPFRMIQTVSSLFFSGELFHHIGITFLEVMISFLVSVSLGLFISILLWRFPLFSKVVDPYLTILNSLPKVALGPLIIIWFGANMKSVIFMSLLISLFVTIINIYTGFLSVSRNKILMIQSFGGRKNQIFWYVILPSNVQNILSTLKVNISMNLIGVIMGELLVSKSGLGYLIMYGSQVFQLDLVIASVFLLCFISYILYLFINKIK